MRFTLSIFLLMLFVVLSAFSQIRESVFIVRPEYSQETISFLEKTASSLDEKGYGDFSKSIESMETGRFGSGFLYSAENKKKYILTNRHVLDGVNSVTIEHEDPDGNLIRFEGNKVIAVDDILDLALIRLSDDSVSSQGLKLSNNTFHDGEEIWSAGYPGLGGKPSWQFGKGSITNSSARVEDLVDPDRTTLIQHSAPVDPGNSGGPLLVAEERGNTYSVVGINTWKAFSRQAANFAIPSQVIKTFIDNNLTINTQTDRSMFLDQRIDDFLSLMKIEDENEMEKNISRLARFISIEYVKTYGEDALEEVLKYAPGGIRKEVIHNLTLSSPIEGIRLSIAYSLYNGLSERFGEDELKLSTDEKTDIKAGRFAVNFNIGDGNTVTSSWVEKNRSWHLETIDYGQNVVHEEDTKATTSYSFEKPYQVLFFGELSSISDFGIITGVGTLLSAQFISFGAAVDYGEIEYNDPMWGLTTSSLVRVLMIGRAQFPIVTDTLIINPYFELRGGIQVDTVMDLGGILSNYGLGFQLGYNKGTMGYLLSIAWNKESIIGDSDNQDFYKYNVFTISLGLGLR